MDWLVNVSNFAAGAGDSLTFGITVLIRDAIGTNDVVNKCSGAYKNGELAEIGAVIALTAGAGVLKQMAKRTTNKAARNAAEEFVALPTTVPL